MRQTQVIVVPSNQVFTNSFATFDTLIESINQARRNARDYVTDVSLEKLDENYGDGERDWSVSVNCAHLHPKFGEPTPEEELEEMKNEDLDGEVDLNLKAYKEKRLLARRSPYPTIVIEVRVLKHSLENRQPWIILQKPTLFKTRTISTTPLEKRLVLMKYPS